MIRGEVNANQEAILNLQLHGPAGQMHQVEVVIDTGFNGFLILPPAVVAKLGLVPLTRGRAILANGREDVFTIYEVMVVWGDRLVAVEVGALEAALVGMSLLYGHELRIQVLEGGHVIVEALS